MASSRIVSRLSSGLQPLALKLNNKKASLLSNNASLLKSASQSAMNRRLCLISRLPVELSSLETMMPLHSAIASARLQSSLSLESQRWGLVPQVASDYTFQGKVNLLFKVVNSSRLLVFETGNVFRATKKA